MPLPREPSVPVAPRAHGARREAGRRPQSLSGRKQPESVCLGGLLGGLLRPLPLLLQAKQLGQAALAQTRSSWPGRCGGGTLPGGGGLEGAEGSAPRAPVGLCFLHPVLLAQETWAIPAAIGLRVKPSHIPGASPAWSG